MKFPTALLTSFVVATSLQGVELLTADGAWTDFGINASSAPKPIPITVELSIHSAVLRTGPTM